MKVLAALSVAAMCALLAATLLQVNLRVATSVRREGVPTHGRRQQEWLLQSGSSITLRQFRLLQIGLFLAGYLVALIATGVAAIAFAPAMAMAGIPKATLERARLRQHADLRAAWPDALRDVHASIVSGTSLSQALLALQRTGPLPVREAFTRFEPLLRIVGLEAALEVIREELADPMSDRILEVLIVAHQRGGQIVSEILEDLVQSATRDLKLAEEIDAAGLESRINARVVMVLPWVVLGFLCIGNSEFRAFYSEAAGLVVVVIGAALTLFGAFVLRRLGATAPETRVLVSMGVPE